MAGSNSTSTREKLLGLVDDIELITKEIFENAIAPKAKRLSAQEHEELTTLLIQKDSELKDTMSLAAQQGNIDKNMKSLQEEVQKQDNCIRQLQKQLKDAETLLSTAIYQANQKLDSIKKAKENPVSSEELIKYAHRISASNAVSAPLNWQQGDPRRPYPTDMEMRLGLLGRTEQVALEMSRNAQASGERGNRTPAVGSTPGGMPGTPGSSHIQGPTSGSQMHHPDFHHPSPQHGHMGMAGMHSSPTKMHPAGGTQGHHGHQAGAPYHWSHGAEMPIPGAAGGSRGENMPLDSSGMHHYQSQQQQFHGGGHQYPPLGHGQQQQGQHNRGMAGAGANTGAGATDDVEVMSTDSSSSSSTDSN